MQWWMMLIMSLNQMEIHQGWLGLSKFDLTSWSPLALHKEKLSRKFSSPCNQYAQWQEGDYTGSSRILHTMPKRIRQADSIHVFQHAIRFIVCIPVRFVNGYVLITKKRQGWRTRCMQGGGEMEGGSIDSWMHAKCNNCPLGVTDPVFIDLLAYRVQKTQWQP